MEGFFSDDKSKIVFRGKVEVCREYDEKKDITVLEFKEENYSPKIGDIIVVERKYIGVFKGYDCTKNIKESFEYVCNLDGTITPISFYCYLLLLTIRPATSKETYIFKRCLHDQDKHWDENKKEIINIRATGRTTRLIDSYIQELFENINKHVIIKDHYYSKQADRYLMTRIHDRLKYEHPNVGFLCKIIDNNYTIKIIK